MSEWQEMTLDEAASINPRESLSAGTVAKKISMTDLQPYTKKVITYSLEAYKGGMKFRNGDTLVARITPCLENGKTAYVDILEGEEIGFGSTEYIVIREKPGISDKQFLYYFLISPAFRDVAILSMTGSSGRQRVQTDVVTSHKFQLPGLPEQKAIGSVLSSLDEKIELLDRQNKTLEAMAEMLFRQRFVEEPDINWRLQNILDVVQLVGGGTPKTSTPEYWNGEIPWLSGGDIAASHKSFAIDSESKISQIGLENSAAKLLPKYATVISARGTVGKYCLLAKPMAFSQSNYGILPRFDECYFFAYLLINNVVEELQSSAYGSVFDTITTDTFKGINLPLPGENVVRGFEEEVTAIFKKMLLNKEQIQTLEKIRDTLLPKLMTRELSVGYERRGH